MNYWWLGFNFYFKLIACPAWARLALASYIFRESVPLICISLPNGYLYIVIQSFEVKMVLNNENDD